MISSNKFRIVVLAIASSALCNAQSIVIDNVPDGTDEADSQEDENGKRPFIDTYELSIAVNEYLADPTNPDSEVAKTYGWPIGTWNVGLITNFVNLFSQKSDVVFDDSLTGWDTSNVDDMSSIFLGCTNCNPDISSWDVSKIINMYGMFCLTDTFNSDISKWDTAKVENMGALFSQSLSFDQDISGWDVSNVSINALSSVLCQIVLPDFMSFIVHDLTHAIIILNLGRGLHGSLRHRNFIQCRSIEMGHVFRNFHEEHVYVR